MLDGILLELAAIEVRQRKILNVLRENNLIAWNGIVTNRELWPVYEKIRKRVISLKESAEQNPMEGFPLSE